MQQGSALVLFSGGQDSTVCLTWALQRYDRVETIGFDYGQRHAIELQTRTGLRERLRDLLPGAVAKLGDDHILQLPTLGRISETSLTRATEIEMGEAGLPSTFVPGRNLLFFTYAAALGWRRGITTSRRRHVRDGLLRLSGLPAGHTHPIAEAISLGMDRPFTIETPLMHVDKAGTWAMADELGGAALVDLIIEYSHTCYLGDREHRHEWGYGCGTCPACELRANGWTQWKAGKTS